MRPLAKIISASDRSERDPTGRPVGSSRPQTLRLRHQKCVRVIDGTCLEAASSTYKPFRPSWQKIVSESDRSGRDPTGTCRIRQVSAGSDRSTCRIKHLFSRGSAQRLARGPRSLWTGPIDDPNTAAPSEDRKKCLPQIGVQANRTRARTGLS